MAHFAEIIEGKVTRVLVTDNAWTTEETVMWLHNNISTNEWLKCSYNNNIRNIFPGVGYEYHEDLDVFTEPKPYDDWVLNLETLKYEPTETSLVQWSDLQIGE